jgi:hypothetical protein
MVPLADPEIEVLMVLVAVISITGWAGTEGGAWYKPLASIDP